MDKERKEDLNPRSDDIEERVRQMLDLSVSDESKAELAEIPKKSGKSIKIQTAEPAEEPDAPLSAPELPTAKTSKKSSQEPGSKKVTMPISLGPEDILKNDDTTVTDPEPAPVKKITISEDTNESAADIADKLDQAIADLSPETTPETSSSASEELEAPKDSAVHVASQPEASEPEPADIANPETDKAVDAIIAEESDQLLKLEDAIRETDEPVVPAKKPRKQRSHNLRGFLAKPAFRRALVLLAIGILLAVAAVPQTRYLALNTAGIRVESSLTILDDSTQQPLKNVQVKLDDATAVTDVNGKVQFSKVRLGKHLLTVDKRAFAPVNKTVILGLGSNPLGDIRLTPTGSQYSFKVTDFLSGKAVAKAEAASGDASAISDDNGLIKLTLDKLTDGPISVAISGKNYRTENLEIDPDKKEPNDVKMVSARKHLFVSKRSGKYDIYSIYSDGKDEQSVLAGSGKEREDMVLVPHPSENIAAYVSTRPGQTNSEGYMLSNLILIKTDENNDTINVKSSERIQIVDWSGSYLVYVQIKSGTSASSPDRYRLMSYNYKDQSEKELAASNFFNDVIYANGAIYYAPSGAYQSGEVNFHKVNPDGSGNQVVFNREVWNIFRTSYDNFALSVQQQWYDYRIGGSQPTKLNSAPSDQTTRVYIGSPDGRHSAWTDNRDGKGVLLVYDISAKTDKALRSQAGLTYPTSWLNDSVLVYRVKSPQETADYAISIDGGEPVKIRDVTNTGGIDRWYYY